MIEPNLIVYRCIRLYRICVYHCMLDGIPLFVSVCIGTEFRYAIVCSGVSFHPMPDGIIPPHGDGRIGYRGNCSGGTEGNEHPHRGIVRLDSPEEISRADPREKIAHPRDGICGLIRVIARHLRRYVHNILLILNVSAKCLRQRK